MQYFHCLPLTFGGFYLWSHIDHKAINLRQTYFWSHFYCRGINIINVKSGTKRVTHQEWACLKFYGIGATFVVHKCTVFLTTYDSHDDSPLSNACRMALSISLDDPLPPILNSNTVTRSRFFKVSFTISQCLTRFFFPKFSSTWFRISASTEASNIVCVLSKRTLKRLIYAWPTFWFFQFPPAHLSYCWKLWFSNLSVISSIN